MTSPTIQIVLWDLRIPIKAVMSTCSNYYKLEVIGKKMNHIYVVMNRNNEIMTRIGSTHVFCSIANKAILTTTIFKPQYSY